MLVVIRGAGDIATGIALRLYRAGIRLVLTDLPQQRRSAARHAFRKRFDWAKQSLRACMHAEPIAQPKRQH